MYLFQRKSTLGNVGKFYVTDLMKLNHKPETVMIQTVQENMTYFTKREIAGASHALKALATLGYPSVPEACKIVSTGEKFQDVRSGFPSCSSHMGA